MFWAGIQQAWPFAGRSVRAIDEEFVAASFALLGSPGRVALTRI